MTGTAQNPLNARHELREGWRLLIATAAGASLAPITIYTLGLFVEPLQAEFGWSRGFITSALTIYALLSVTLAGPVGYLIDLYGPRRIALPGVVLFCVAVAALAAATPEKLSWWALWLFVAAGAVLVKATVWTAAIVSRFNAARGIALALTLCGGSTTAILGPLIARLLIENYGWRMGYVGLAIIWAAICVPIIWTLFYSRHDLERVKGAATSSHVAARDKAGLREAIGSAPFIKLALASFLLVFTVTGASVHLVPLLSHAGIGRASAAGLASLIGLAAFFGRLTSGSLLDRIDGRMVGTIVSALPTVAFLCLFFCGDNTVLAAAAAFVLGLCTGAEFEIAAYLSSRFFRGSDFGTLFGLVNGMISLGAGLGSTAYGFAFDWTGSYNAPLLAAIPLTLASSALIWSLGSVPRIARQQEQGSRTTGRGITSGHRG